MNLKKINVLVTGAGSGVGQGIIKSLLISKLNLRIFSSDINLKNAGLFFTKQYILLPKVEKKNSLERIIKIIKKNKINIIFIGSEFDLNFFSKYKNLIEEKTNVLVCVSSYKTIKIANDKFKTFEFLKKNNLPYPESYIPKSFEDSCKLALKIKYPFFLKTRIGTSSRDVYLIKNSRELKKYFTNVKNPMVQKFAGYKEGGLKNEFTSSLFKTREGSIIGPITLKRVVKYGTSWIAEVNDFKEFDHQLLEIANNLNFEGSINIQFRRGKKGIVPFEINSRISGTCAIRTHYGFNEPEMYIKNYFFKKKLKKPKIKQGLCFRYNEEIFLDNMNFLKLKNAKKNNGIIKKWFQKK